MATERAERTAILFVLSGPSGVGKDALLQQLRRRCPDLHYAVTATTRPQRPDEVPGSSYYFLTRKEYERQRAAGRFLAPAHVHGHLYGAPLEQIDPALKRGQDVMLKIDVQGAIDVQRRVSGAVFIFLAPPSPHTLLERLRARHTESQQELERRLKDARFELSQAPNYDYLVVNREGDLGGSVSDVECIITAE